MDLFLSTIRERIDYFVDDDTFLFSLLYRVKFWFCWSSNSDQIKQSIWQVHWANNLRSSRNNILTMEYWDESLLSASFNSGERCVVSSFDWAEIGVTALNLKRSRSIILNSFLGVFSDPSLSSFLLTACEGSCMRLDLDCTTTDINNSPTPLCS